MKRKIKSKLIEWKNSEDHVALLITGARQVGKTYIIEEFGKENYPNFLTINLMSESFEDGFWKGNASQLIQKITLRYSGFNIEKGESLLFLDEIQESPDAMIALKTLVAEGTLDIIASGSLLGMQEKSPKSYPVGYVHEIRMHPMDFEEYLWALGMSEELTAYIRDHVSSSEPFDVHELHAIEEHYRRYLVIGGMPRPVLRSIESDDSGKFQEAQDDIIEGYRKDILAYADESIRGDVLRLLEIIPSELGKRNKRLMFKDIDGISNRGIREYREPIDWVSGSNFVTICRRLGAIERPLPKNASGSMFKMYMTDTGLLVRMYGESTVQAMMRKDLSVNEGAIAENSVCQMLTACGLKPYYYEVDKEVEVDFIAEIGAEICAIEVKSGKHRRARSLKKLMEMDSGKAVDRWIKFENGNIMITDDGVEHYPLFCAAFADLLASEKVTPWRTSSRSS